MSKATRVPPKLNDLDVGMERKLYAFTTTAAALAPDPKAEIEHLLRYIEACPTGHKNREVAERIEEALLNVPSSHRALYHARYRSARDPYMPDVERQPVSRLRRSNRLD